MAIVLQKGQKINLRKETGEKLERFCVEVNWGAIETIKKGLLWNKKVIEDVDLDLSAIIVDKNGQKIDHVYSPLFNTFLKKNNLPLGKLVSEDQCLKHSGDDLGKGGGNDFREVVEIDLSRASKNACQIFFFLNIYLTSEQSYDFSHIPFAQIKMYEGTPTHVKKDYLTFDVRTNNDYSGLQCFNYG